MRMLSLFIMTVLPKKWAQKMKQDQNFRYVGATISILEKISEKSDSSGTTSDNTDQNTSCFEDLLRDRLKSSSAQRQPKSMLSLSVTSGLPDQVLGSESDQTALRSKMPISLTSRYVHSLGGQAAALSLAAKTHQSSKQI